MRKQKTIEPFSKFIKIAAGLAPCRAPGSTVLRNCAKLCHTIGKMLTIFKVFIVETIKAKSN